MNTRQLPYILAINSTGSLTEAARELQISQPALSKYLANLEQEIKLDLFFRHKKRLYPTPAGKIYIEAAEEILRLLEQTAPDLHLHTKTLEYILAIAEEKSVSRAAARFYLSQAALSKHLRQVEDQLGEALFIRNSHPITATETGLVFLRNAQAILRMEARLEEDLAKLRHNQKQSLTFLSEPYYMNFFMTRILPAFRKQHPDFHLRAASTTPEKAQSALMNQEATLALFTTNHLKNEYLEQIPLFSDELMLVYSNDSVQTSPTAEDKMLAHNLRDCIFYLHPPKTAFRSMEEHWMESLGFIPRTVIEIDDFQFALRQIQHSRGCAFIPRERLKKEDLDKFGLTAVSAQVPCCFHLVLAYPPDISFPRPIWDFIKITTKQFESFMRYIITKA